MSGWVASISWEVGISRVNNFWSQIFPVWSSLQSDRIWSDIQKEVWKNMLYCFNVVTHDFCICSDLVGQSSHPAASRTSLLMLTMGLPASVACLSPQLFVVALEVSGIIRLLLFAVIPALMMMKGPWAGSKTKGYLVVAFFTCISAVIIGIDLLGKMSFFWKDWEGESGKQAGHFMNFT